MAIERLSKEGALQKEAFEFYYHLGSQRSLRLVAEKFDRTERTVAGWSRSFNWVARVQQREIEEDKNLNTGNISAQTTDVRTRYRIVLNNLIAKATKSIADGTLKIKTIKDLDTIIKLDLLLMGEATDKVELAGVAGFTKEDKEELKALLVSLHDMKE